MSAKARTFIVTLFSVAIVYTHITISRFYNYSFILFIQFLPAKLETFFGDRILLFPGLKPNNRNQYNSQICE